MRNGFEDDKKSDEHGNGGKGRQADRASEFTHLEKRFP
jgi:hypothetical protein